MAWFTIVVTLLIMKKYGILIRVTNT